MCEAAQRSEVGAVVESGELRVAVGGKLQSQSGERGVCAIAFDEFGDEGREFLFDGGAERIVERRGGVGRARSGALRRDRIRQMRFGRSAALGLESDERRGKLQIMNPA